MEYSDDMDAYSDHNVICYTNNILSFEISKITPIPYNHKMCSIRDSSGEILLLFP
jgi:hypothetical protein